MTGPDFRSPLGQDPDTAPAVPDATPDARLAAPAAPPTEPTTTSSAAETVERPHPLTPIVQVWIWLVGAAYFFGRQYLESGTRDLPPISELPFPVLIGVGLGVLTILVSLWQWWTTRFVVTPDELRIEHRGVAHDTKRVAFQRIQSVDVTQPFAARLLGLAQLTIDVGGGSPLRLQYLARTRATELRDLLLHRAHGRRGATEARETSAWTDAGASDRVLIKVPPSELILGAVLSHDLLILVAFAVVPLVIGLILGEPLLVGGGIVPVLLAIAGFVSKRVLGQWNYTLAQTPAGLRITRGLTSLSSETLPVHRIQGIRLREPVLWRRVGRTQIDLTFVGLGRGGDDEGPKSSSVLLPIGRPADVEVALHAVWPGLHLDAIPLIPSPPRARLLAPLALPWMGHGWDDVVLVLRRGWWTRTTSILPHARLQSVRAIQGPVRRALAVASVEAHTAETLSSNPRVHLTASDAALFVRGEAARARRARQREASELARQRRSAGGASAESRAPIVTSPALLSGPGPQ